MDTQVQVSNSSTTTISGYGVDRGGPGPASHHPSAYDDSTPLLNRQHHRGTTPLPPSGSGELSPSPLTPQSGLTIIGFQCEVTVTRARTW